MKKNYTDEITALSQEIEKSGDVWELYYQRGYLYFLNDEDDNAKDDYKHALALGLDPTEVPYYSFSTSNSKRREFLLPEKIMVFLLLLVVIAALIIQIASFIIKIKGSI